MGTVGQLMTSNLRLINEGVPIQEAATMMHRHRIGSLFVRRDEEFVGIITETDVVQAVAEQPRNIERLTVQEVMSRPIITVDRTMAPHYARDLMADRKIRHLGVTQDGKIVGVISVRDLLAYFKTVSKELEDS
ncbi:MAG: CBS domain-containing protein [Nitrospirota bacterium]|nr:CBS domain-containing protein [Nitrospirota bacterium]